MKTFFSLMIILLFTVGSVEAQDTLYMYKAGFVMNKRAVIDMDSITFTYIPPLSGTLKDIDGNSYHWIKIGTQTWMVENLNVSKYRTGESISNVTDSTAWGSASFGAWCNYNNDPAFGSKYGKLYNWNAVNDSRKIAPVGWHIPSDAEWTTLTEFVATHLGVSTNVAKALAATTEWKTDTSSGSIGNNLTINNSSGFNALPSGFRDFDGRFTGFGINNYFSSSTEYISTVNYEPNGLYIRSLYFSKNFVTGGVFFKSYGFSIRCIKD